MNQNKQAPRRRMTRREWRIRRCLRLARNWAVFLAACGAAVALMTSGILWLLPKAHALIAGPEAFVARNYDGTEYQLNLADARLVLVNGNLPLDAEPAPALAVADDATGQQLEAEAAEKISKQLQNLTRLDTVDGSGTSAKAALAIKFGTGSGSTTVQVGVQVDNE